MSTQAAYIRNRRDAANAWAQNRSAQRAYRVRQKEARVPDRRVVAEALLQLMTERKPAKRFLDLIGPRLIDMGYDKRAAATVAAAVFRIKTEA